MYESPRFYLFGKLYALAVLAKSWALLDVSSNAKPSMRGFRIQGLGLLGFVPSATFATWQPLRLGAAGAADSVFGWASVKGYP